jgi:hypothetical protein
LSSVLDPLRFAMNLLPSCCAIGPSTDLANQYWVAAAVASSCLERF